MPSQARFHGAQVQFHYVGVLSLALIPEPLFFGVLLHSIDTLRGSARKPKIVNRLRIYGEEPHGGSVLRGHVGDGGPVCQFQIAVARAAEFHELADDTLLPEHLHDSQNKIGGVHAGPEPAREPESYHFGNVDVTWLTDHDGFRFDTPHSPTDDTEAVYLRGVRVSAEA